MNMVLVLRGPAGVGKSTVARLIQEQLGVNWVVLDVDVFKKYMQLKEGESNRAERSKIAHDVSKFFAKEAYHKGYDIIMEEMYKKPYNDSLVAFLQENGMQYLKVFLYAPVDVVVERSAHREKKPPAEELRRHYADVEPYKDDFVIDTTKYSSEKIVGLIVEKISALKSAQLPPIRQTP